ncbi:uncharacterized protein [Temnothorax longispinosus]|uniref:uncharacterized protein isoform X2 n=1 Tax=Temnothorax longispinosus TaxID=300112 RepID=UPI003A98FCE2
MEQYKCGYCKWILKHDQLEQHSCFANNLHSLVMDNERRIFITDRLDENFSETNEDNVQDKDRLDEDLNETNEDNVQDKDRLDENFSETNEDNVQDKDRLDEDLNETNEDNVQDKDRLDEELISAVKNRPALYDSSLPVKQRGRKQKDRLWNEVSVLLKGLYTPSEAEKRWNYLRDCYRKAKNAFKKRQAMLQRSGAAGIPKSETIMPSFRHYNEMTFLNDTLEHRQTVTSLKAAINNEQTSTSSANINDLDDVQSAPGSSSISTTSKKRKKFQSVDKCDEVLIQALKENKDPTPIDGFLLRLSEGLRRLSYEERSKLEIEFLTRLYEIEVAKET